MTAEADVAEAELFEQARAAGGIGPVLGQARAAAGLTLGDISARTRIAERHLAAIEQGRFADLASRAYAVGFARAYARNVGLDEQTVADAVRAEIAQSEDAAPPRQAVFEPGDPARVPGRRTAWLAALSAVALLGVVYVTWRTLLAPGGELPSLLPDPSPTAAAASAASTPAASAVASAAPSGAVVFTATEPGIWVKFYDAAGRQLLQKQMARGESYTVPADAAGPRLWTGRPDALAITIGGAPVPPIAARQRIVKNVPVSAAALLARGAPAPDASAAAASPTGAPPVADTSPVG